MGEGRLETEYLTVPRAGKKRLKKFVGAGREEEKKGTAFRWGDLPN